MNIEDIKERVTKREYYVYESEHEVQYHEDILHLLSIIEQAEVALGYIAYSENIGAMNSRAEDALKLLGKDE